MLSGEMKNRFLITLDEDKILPETALLAEKIKKMKG